MKSISLDYIKQTLNPHIKNDFIFKERYLNGKFHKKIEFYI